jgi:cyclopropane fatty-acyl-phospholipid synthase-like methyltransferase
MRNYDNSWGKLKPEQMPGKIITGAKTKGDLKPSEWLIAKMFTDISVLDFGCGIGRNSFRLAECGHKVTAYDLPNMIEILGTDPRMPTYKDELSLTSDWLKVGLEKYDAILASLVIQHLPEDVAEDYLGTLATMSQHLLVHTRAYMDFTGKPILPLLEKYFLIDLNRTSPEAVKQAVGCKGENHFWLWLMPKKEVK